MKYNGSKKKRSRIVREIEDSWAFAVERARRRGNPGTLWHRIDKNIVYWRQHAPDGMPKEFFDRYFKACFTQAVLIGDPDFFAVMDRASGLLAMLFSGSRPRPPVKPPKDEERRRRMKSHKSGPAWGNVSRELAALGWGVLALETQVPAPPVSRGGEGEG